MTVYWTTDEEVTLLHLVLESCDPAELRDRSIADGILTGLIEMGLSDMDRGPAVFTAWADTAEWDGSSEVPRDFVAKHYVIPEDEDEELSRLEDEFAAAGGRGVELAERIDLLRERTSA